MYTLHSGSENPHQMSALSAHDTYHGGYSFLYGNAHLLSIIIGILFFRIQNYLKGLLTHSSSSSPWAKFKVPSPSAAGKESAGGLRTQTQTQTATMGSRTITDVLALPHATGNIPQLGFGVYKSPAAVAAQSCLSALEAGYRHIDSAQLYANEKEVGEALKQTSIPRKDIFVTTKILDPAGSVDKNYAKCLESVQKLDGDGYVDLFLVHNPKCGSENVREMWLALERLHDEGKAKSIGVSNFGIKHIEDMKRYARIWPPTVNQIEV